MDKITQWFEDEDFMIELIKRGIGSMGQDGATNTAGMFSYVFDRKYQRDAELISKLVAKHNKEPGNE